jgi:hypothetical protein
MFITLKYEPSKITKKRKHSSLKFNAFNYNPKLYTIQLIQVCRLAIHHRNHPQIHHFCRPLENYNLYRHHQVHHL